MENYEQKYKEALKKLRRLHDDYDRISSLVNFKEELENNFPELKESEDERLRKAVLKLTEGISAEEVLKEYGLTPSDVEKWLERQGGQKPAGWRANGVYPEENGVRIWHDGHTFKVLKNWDRGLCPLLSEDGRKESVQNEERLQNEVEALLDWDFVGATKHIQILGTDIPLGEGEYLPTAPVFLAMYKYKGELNAALKSMGAEEIDFEEDCWFAQRCSAYTAWLFYGIYGHLGTIYVIYAYRARALAL